MPPIAGQLALLAFYKVTCPVCQLAAPYISRFARYQEPGRFTVVAVAEDPPEATRDFESLYGLTVNSLSEAPPYPASSAYGLTNVPTLFLVAPDGTILQTQVGFSKAGYNAISEAVATRLGVATITVAPSDDGAPDLKPG